MSALHPTPMGNRCWPCADGACNTGAGSPPAASCSLRHCSHARSMVRRAFSVARLWLSLLQRSPWACCCCCWGGTMGCPWDCSVGATRGAREGPAPCADAESPRPATRNMVMSFHHWSCTSRGVSCGGGWRRSASAASRGPREAYKKSSRRRADWRDACRHGPLPPGPSAEWLPAGYCFGGGPWRGGPLDGRAGGCRACSEHSGVCQDG